MTNLEKELAARVAVLSKALDDMLNQFGDNPALSAIEHAKRALALVPAAALAEIRAEAFEEAAVAVDPPFKMGHSPSDALRRVAEDERSIAAAASKCGACGGTGNVDEERSELPAACSQCNGTGERKSDHAARRERAVEAALHVAQTTWRDEFDSAFIGAIVDAALAVLAGEEE